jgi:cell division transport system permease protein
MNNFGYFIRESVDSLFANKTATFTTSVTIILSLIVTGLFQIVTVNLVSISEKLSSDFEFMVYINDEVNPEEFDAVADSLRNIELVNGVNFVPKSKTFADWKEQVGDTDLLKGLSEENNPFRNCFKITVIDLSKSENIIDEIKQIGAVEKVSNNLKVAEKMSSISHNVGFWGIAAYILLAILCLSIISNIINMSIFSRRKQINIMKYVGATDWFIKVPFIFEGMIIGLCGSLAASGLLVWGYSFLYSLFGEGFNGIYLLPVLTVLWFVSLFNSLYGIFVGAVGASFAVSKHLNV